MSIDYRDLGYGEIGLTIPKPEGTKRVTNGDRICAMSAEDLAEWLTMIEKRVIKNALSKPFMYTDEQLKADWLEWLKQETDNG